MYEGLSDDDRAMFECDVRNLDLDEYMNALFYGL